MGQWTEWRPPILVRAVLFSQSADSSTNLFWKHAHRHTQKSGYYQLSGYFLTQSSWHIKLTITQSIAVAAKTLQLCLTLCDSLDGSPPGSPVPGILQARTLEWVAISFSNAWKWKVKVKSLNRVRPSATPWTAAHQASPFMGFSRQEYWSGVPLPSPSHSPLQTSKIHILYSVNTIQESMDAHNSATLCGFEESLVDQVDLQWGCSCRNSNDEIWYCII